MNLRFIFTLIFAHSLQLSAESGITTDAAKWTRLCELEAGYKVEPYHYEKTAMNLIDHILNNPSEYDSEIKSCPQFCNMHIKTVLDQAKNLGFTEDINPSTNDLEKLKTLQKLFDTQFPKAERICKPEEYTKLLNEIDPVFIAEKHLEAVRNPKNYGPIEETEKNSAPFISGTEAIELTLAQDNIKAAKVESIEREIATIKAKKSMWHKFKHEDDYRIQAQKKRDASYENLLTHTDTVDWDTQQTHEHDFPTWAHSKDGYDFKTVHDALTSQPATPEEYQKLFLPPDRHATWAADYKKEAELKTAPRHWLRKGIDRGLYEVTRWVPFIHAKTTDDINPSRRIRNIYGDIKRWDPFYRREKRDLRLLRDHIASKIIDMANNIKIKEEKRENLDSEVLHKDINTVRHMMRLLQDYEPNPKRAFLNEMWLYQILGVSDSASIDRFGDFCRQREIEKVFEKILTLADLEKQFKGIPLDNWKHSQLRNFRHDVQGGFTEVASRLLALVFTGGHGDKAYHSFLSKNKLNTLLKERVKEDVVRNKNRFFAEIEKLEKQAVEKERYIDDPWYIPHKIDAVCESSRDYTFMATNTDHAAKVQKLVQDLKYDLFNDYKQIKSYVERSNRTPNDKQARESLLSKLKEMKDKLNKQLAEADSLL